MTVKEDLERRIREYEMTYSPLSEICKTILAKMADELLNKEIDDE
jgi:hypothetical protein